MHEEPALVPPLRHGPQRSDGREGKEALQRKSIAMQELRKYPQPCATSRSRTSMIILSKQSKDTLDAKQTAELIARSEKAGKVPGKVVGPPFKRRGRKKSHDTCKLCKKQQMTLTQSGDVRYCKWLLIRAGKSVPQTFEKPFQCHKCVKSVDRNRDL